MYIPKKVISEIFSRLVASELSQNAHEAVAEIRAAVRQAKEDGVFLFEDLDNYRAISAWTGVEDVMNVMEIAGETSGLSEEEFEEIAAEVTARVDWNGSAFIDQSAGNEVILDVLTEVLAERGLIAE